MIRYLEIGISKAVFLILLANPQPAGASDAEFVLSCDNEKASIVVDTVTSKAQVVAEFEVLSGTVVIEPYFYRFRFGPADVGSLKNVEFRMLINRFTGKGRLETGPAPFSGSNEANDIDHITCVRMSGKPKR